MVCLNQVEDTNYKQSHPPPHGNNNDRDHSWTYLFNGKRNWGYGMATKISSVDTILLFLLSPDSPFLLEVTCHMHRPHQWLQWWGLVGVKKSG